MCTFVQIRPGHIWTTLYLQRKLRDDKGTADVVCELRSRRVGRSGPEPDRDKSNIETSEQTGKELVQPPASPNTNEPVLTHSYILRIRVGTYLLTYSTEQSPSWEANQ